MGFFQTWKEFWSFYGEVVFPRAVQDVGLPIGWPRMGLILAVSYVIAFFVTVAIRGRRIAVDVLVENLIFGLIGPAVVFGGLLLFSLIMAPPRLMKDYRVFESDSRYLAWLMNHLQPQRLEPDDRARLLNALGGIEPREVIIDYVDSPIALANPFAVDLRDALLSIKWKAGVRGQRDRPEHVGRTGVHIYLDQPTNPWPTQQAVIDALDSIGIPVGRIHDGSRHVADRVELLVSHLPPKFYVPRR